MAARLCLWMVLVVAVAARPSHVQLKELFKQTANRQLEGKQNKDFDPSSGPVTDAELRNFVQTLESAFGQMRNYIQDVADILRTSQQDSGEALADDLREVLTGTQDMNSHFMDTYSAADEIALRAFALGVQGKAGGDYCDPSTDDFMHCLRGRFEKMVELYRDALQYILGQADEDDYCGKLKNLLFDDSNNTGNHGSGNNGNNGNGNGNNGHGNGNNGHGNGNNGNRNGNGNGNNGNGNGNGNNGNGNGNKLFQPSFLKSGVEPEERRRLLQEIVASTQLPDIALIRQDLAADFVCVGNHLQNFVDYIGDVQDNLDSASIDDLLNEIARTQIIMHLLAQQGQDIIQVVKVLLRHLEFKAVTAEDLAAFWSTVTDKFTELKDYFEQVTVTLNQAASDSGAALLDDIQQLQDEVMLLIHDFVNLYEHADFLAQRTFILGFAGNYTICNLNNVHDLEDCVRGQIDILFTTYAAIAQFLENQYGDEVDNCVGIRDIIQSAVNGISDDWGPDSRNGSYKSGKSVEKSGKSGKSGEKSGKSVEKSGKSAGKSGKSAEKSGKSAEKSGKSAGKSGKSAEKSGSKDKSNKSSKSGKGSGNGSKGEDPDIDLPDLNIDLDAARAALVSDLACLGGHLANFMQYVDVINAPGLSEDDMRQQFIVTHLIMFWLSEQGSHVFDDIGQLRALLELQLRAGKTRTQKSDSLTKTFSLLRDNLKMKRTWYDDDSSSGDEYGSGSGESGSVESGSVESGSVESGSGESGSGESGSGESGSGESGSGESGSGEYESRKYRSGESGSGESGSGESGSGESGSEESGSGESGSGESGSGESGSEEYGSGESGSGESGSGEYGSGEFGSGESGSGESESGESGDNEDYDKKLEKTLKAVVDRLRKIQQDSRAHTSQRQAKSGKSVRRSNHGNKPAQQDTDVQHLQKLTSFLKKMKKFQT